MTERELADWWGYKKLADMTHRTVEYWENKLKNVPPHIWHQGVLITQDAFWGQTHKCRAVEQFMIDYCNRKTETSKTASV
jgi:hypothetical protein